MHSPSSHPSLIARYLHSLRAQGKSLSSLALAILAIVSLGEVKPAQAEGSYQLERRDETGAVPITINGQGFLEYNSSYSSTASGIPIRTRPMFVDVLNNDEVINISACGLNDNDRVQVQVYYHPPNSFDEFTNPLPNGTLVLNQVLSTNTTGVGRVACNDPMNAPLPNPLRYDSSLGAGGQGRGTYEIRLFNLDRSGPTGVIDRFDVTITPNTTTLPNPTVNQGRLWAYYWGFRARGYDASRAIDTNFHILVPGGFPSTNYVWQLDLNNFAGFAYEILANQLGVDSPNGLGQQVSGFSVPGDSNNSTTPQYKVFMTYPDSSNINPPPSSGQLPTLNNLRFEDDAGIDNSISPSSTSGSQDSGFFRFTTNVDGTYGLLIDIDDGNGNGPDGLYGLGDIYLTGTTEAGIETSVPWNGRDNFGNLIPNGNYNVQAEARVGEYHFTTQDAETSGGGANNGLTIYQAFSNSLTANTLVFWNDITGLGNPAGSTTTWPNGAVSGTTRHTWGNFTAGGFGNLRIIDTYVFGSRTTDTTEVILADVDDDFDFGDAPDSYGDASHIASISSDIFIGSSGPDRESNSLNTANGGSDGDGDNLDGSDDEADVQNNGSSFQGQSLVQGESLTLNMDAAGSGVLNAWFDWNQNGDFLDPGEQVALDVAPSSGAIALPITVPNDAIAGTTYARFRYSSTPGLPPSGSAPDGEVEDYQFSIVAGTSNLTLVKRVTAIDSDRETGIVNDNIANSPDDEVNWPANYLQGTIDTSQAAPAAEIEYTIYFLSNGNFPLTNVNLCDMIPANTTYLPGSLSFVFGSDTEGPLTDTSGDDAGEFFAGSPTDPSICPPDNSKGGVLVNLATSPATVPPATAPGSPNNSHGYVRFRALID